MEIVKWEWHQKQKLYSGEAVSTRGRRYFFGAKKTGKMMWIDRQVGQEGQWWLHLRTGPAALTHAVRARVRR